MDRRDRPLGDDADGGLASAHRSLLAWRVAGLALVALAVGIRVHNALSYPADWGFDASANWRYIYRLSEDRALPHPAAGWSTADPPLYFVAGAVVMAGLTAAGSRDLAVVAIPLLGTLAGLGVVALAVSLVRRTQPEDELRAWLAGLLLLYLPAHAHASVMVNEEILVALLVAFAAWSLAAFPGAGDPAAGRAGTAPRRAFVTGLAGGLALLTKLTGALAVAAAGTTYALEGWRRRAPRPALRCLAAFGLAVLLAGGWWFARNRVVFGFFQPFGLPAHQIMFDMPPGERGALDYVKVPVATFTDPQLLSPALLHSVWGSTYVATWFDGHRFLLPRDDAAVDRLGTATLLLALLPTLAFALGLARGVRRARDRPGSPDLPLVLLGALTLLGFAAYTWRNPWFAVVKGTSLSALALPFAFYASETLAGWLRGPHARRWATAAALAALAACTAAGFAFDGLFPKEEIPGLDWRAPAAR